jgi:hypothetical protein
MYKCYHKLALVLVVHNFAATPDVYYAVCFLSHDCPYCTIQNFTLDFHISVQTDFWTLSHVVSFIDFSLLGVWAGFVGMYR